MTAFDARPPTRESARRTATADHSAPCRVAHALQASNLRVPFLANPLDPDDARHAGALAT